MPIVALPFEEESGFDNDMPMTRYHYRHASYINNRLASLHNDCIKQRSLQQEVFCSQTTDCLDWYCINREVSRCR